MSIETPERVATTRRSQRVVTALESTSRQVNQFGLAMGLVGISMTLLAGLTLVAVADVIWVLPRWARAIALVGMISAAIAYLIYFLKTRQKVFGPNEVAARIEAAYPQLGQRVRTTLEYLEPTASTMPASSSLVDALVADTDRRSRPLSFSVVVPWSKLNARAVGLVSSIVAVIAGVILEPNLQIAACRVLLIPSYYSTLVIEPGDQTLKEGSDFTIRATISGRSVRSAQWLRRCSAPHSKWVESTLGDSTHPLTGVVESVANEIHEDFDYKVVAGDIESRLYHVRVTHPLQLNSIEAKIDPPAYTKLKPTIARDGDFRMAEGSKVHFSIELDRKPNSARIEWKVDGSPELRRVPLVVAGNHLSGELPPIDKDASYQVVATSEGGMTLEPVEHRIKVTPDRKPTIRFLKPTENYSATPTTEVPIKIHSDDDYGLTKVGIVYRIGDGPEETLYASETSDLPLTADVLATLYLEKHKLTISDSLSYQAFVEDNKAPTHQRATSELRFIDIRPYKQEFQLAEGSSGSSNGTSATLEELILRQRLNLNRTLSHLDDRPIAEKVADRLSKDEAELTFTTEEFATKLSAQFGLINPLTDAARAMQAATSSLAAGDFAGSMPLEQSALASLVKARQNVKMLMSQASTAAQFQKLDHKQNNQKFRQAPAEKSAEAELARLEADIRKLAETEKKVADELEAGSTPSSSTAQRQQDANDEAERLSTLASVDKSLTELARDRMNDAAQSIKQSADALKTNDLRESKESAREAVDKLERLADQIAALKVEDLAARMTRARDLAQATARAEKELTTNPSSTQKSEIARRQARLAEDVKTLADLLKQTKSDAVEQDRTIASALERATENNSLEDLESAMRLAAKQIEANHPEKSTEAMKAVAAKLDEIAATVDAARRDAMQPKLQQLLDAEKQAAEARKALESASSEAKKAEAEKAMADLARALEALKPSSGALQDAKEALDQATKAGGSNSWNRPSKSDPTPGLLKPPPAYTNAVGQVAKALQAKIQELVLSDGLVDRDGPVPPGYKDKVENYFRVLSEDLR